MATQPSDVNPTMRIQDAIFVATFNTSKKYIC